MSFPTPPSAATSSLRQVGVQEHQNPDREGRRGEERGDDDAKAKHDSPARKRRISGLGRRRGVRVRLYSRVEAREVPYSILLALGSGARVPVSGFAEVDFRAISALVTNAKVVLCTCITLIRGERVVPERFFKSLLRVK